MVKLIYGSSVELLAAEVANQLGVSPSPRRLRRFNDGEIYIEIQDALANQPVVIVQSTSMPANDHLMELLLLADAARRANAASITAVMPYFGYARQDRVTQAHTPISAKLVANMIQMAGVDRIITFDLHKEQLEGFFDIPVHHIRANELWAEDVRRRQIQDPMVVSPDIGGVMRCRMLANYLDCDWTVIDKQRDPKSQQITHMQLISPVIGRDCLLVDDMIDSGGTLLKAAAILQEQGARSISIYVSHGILSDNSPEKIQNSVIDGCFISDSIAFSPSVKNCDKIQQLSISSLLANAIRDCVLV